MIAALCSSFPSPSPLPQSWERCVLSHEARQDEELQRRPQERRYFRLSAQCFRQLYFLGAILDKNMFQWMEHLIIFFAIQSGEAAYFVVVVCN